MSLDKLIDSLPEYAKDLKLNYSSLIRQNTELTKTQIWGSFLVSAIATRQPALTGAGAAGRGGTSDGRASGCSKDRRSADGNEQHLLSFPSSNKERGVCHDASAVANEWNSHSQG